MYKIVSGPFSLIEKAFFYFSHSVKTLLSIHTQGPERYKNPSTSLLTPWMGYEQASFSKIIMGGWILALGTPDIWRTIFITWPPNTTLQYLNSSSTTNPIVFFIVHIDNKVSFIHVLHCFFVQLSWIGLPLDFPQDHCHSLLNLKNIFSRGPQFPILRADENDVSLLEWLRPGDYIFSKCWCSIVGKKMGIVNGMIRFSSKYAAIIFKRLGESFTPAWYSQ